MEVLQPKLRDNIRVDAPTKPAYATILTPEALDFIAELHRRFNTSRLRLLQLRHERQQRLNTGELPTFLNETSQIREAEWTIGRIPASLQNRRVEITGPVDRKMIVNALNSGANVYMADFEDSTSPTWNNLIDGQLNLFDAVRRQIDFETSDGKKYALAEKVAVLKIRPRGWHLEEKHILINGERVSGSLVDFGLFFFHNARRLALQEQGPFFYLPKLESHLEARLWNDVFVAAQEILGIPQGTIKATVLIETILAAFEMDEILFELRDHIDGLNAGRWDYIFSIIKKLNRHSDFVLPDRSRVTMAVPFMKAYAKQLVKVCHRRGAHAMGGMSAFIPSKDDEINSRAFAQVTTDKEREAELGYDGTWVAHPRLVEVAKVVFDKKLGDRPHQKENNLDQPNIAGYELLDTQSVDPVITEAGLRTNINVSLLYIESWLRGVGAAALYNLMEDAATAEISRAQLWQWLHHQTLLDDHQPVTEELYLKLRQEELLKISEGLQGTQRLQLACVILDGLVLNEDFEEFLTTKAYEHLES